MNHYILLVVQDIHEYYHFYRNITGNIVNQYFMIHTEVKSSVPVGKQQNLCYPIGVHDVPIGWFTTNHQFQRIPAKRNISETDNEKCVPILGSRSTIIKPFVWIQLFAPGDFYKLCSYHRICNIVLAKLIKIKN
jgi:hypothetical protein